jgi:hypothetical protein
MRADRFQRFAEIGGDLEEVAAGALQVFRVDLLARRFEDRFVGVGVLLADRLDLGHVFGARGIGAGKDLGARGGDRDHGHGDHQRGCRQQSLQKSPCAAQITAPWP